MDFFFEGIYWISCHIKLITEIQDRKTTEKLYWIEGHMVYTNTLRKNLYIGQGTVCVIESLN